MLSYKLAQYSTLKTQHLTLREMKFKNDIHNNRARVGATIFAILLLIFIFFFGLTYLNPPPEDGIAINFGYEESGSGNTASSEKVVEPVEKSTQAETTPTETTPTITDQVATQETIDAPAVEKKEDPKPKTEKVEEKKEPVKEEPKPSNDLLDRLDKTKNQKEASNNDGNKTGEGEKKGGGDQGDPSGDPNSPNREGNGGIGNSGNYRLGTRAALNKPKPAYVCNEEGRVVVKVWVDRSGKVVRAVPGEAIPDGGPASTTAANCLLSKAKEAALKTTWHGDTNAAERQQGYIIYNFSKN